MAFNGTEGDAIPTIDAAALTAKWRKNNPNARIGTFIGMDILKDILDQEGCVGIRIYYGENNDDEMEPVFVGADAEQNDILEIVADVSRPVPPFGGVNNALNS